MTNAADVLVYIQNLPVISIISGVVALFWIIFSFSITYHWLVYGRNILVSIFVLILYFGVSLFLIGSILTHLSHV
jgi:hypothetical protein